MKLKFNNIRDLSDGRYASAMMADWIGFSVGAPDSLSVSQIREILGWCSGPLCILELSKGADPNLLGEYSSAFGVQGFELHADDYTKWKDLEIFRDQICIIKTDEILTENVITHSRAQQFLENHISNFSELPAAESLPENLWAMSLDCFPAENPALKNYDAWNDFFEAIGRF